eukprot:COSAG01_NODE_22061_length_873_cov_1.644703_2_plen_47_part_01
MSNRYARKAREAFPDTRPLWETARNAKKALDAVPSPFFPSLFLLRYA